MESKKTASLAAILKHRGKSYLLTEMPKEVKLSKCEELILRARLSGMSFIQLGKAELKLATDQIMTRCAAISGCDLPGTEYFADILSSEIIEFISEYGYGEYTVDEIITAIRLNSMTGLRWPSGMEIEHIGFKGTVFSIDYLSKVLGQYNQLRYILDQRFQNYIDGY